MSEEILAYKVVLIGESGVGKTSIIERYDSNTFKSETKPTPGAQYKAKNIFLEEFKTDIKLEIWDTAGIEKYRALTRIFYKRTNAIILVYDITKKSSFEKLKEYWIPDLKTNGDPNASKFIYISLIYFIFSFVSCWK